MQIWVGTVYMGWHNKYKPKLLFVLRTGEKLPDLCTGGAIKVEKNPVTHEDLDKYDQGIKDGTGICDDTVDPPKISISGCSIYQAWLMVFKQTQC